jgi:transcriptional regulator with XRE-family HTH domain
MRIVDPERPNGTCRFAQLIRESRLAAGMSQKALGNCIHRTDVFISQIENGSKVITDLVVLNNLSKALYIPLDNILDSIFEDKKDLLLTQVQKDTIDALVAIISKSPELDTGNLNIIVSIVKAYVRAAKENKLKGAN